MKKRIIATLYDVPTREYTQTVQEAIEDNVCGSSEEDIVSWLDEDPHTDLSGAAYPLVGVYVFDQHSSPESIPQEAYDEALFVLARKIGMKELIKRNAELYELLSETLNNEVIDLLVND